MFLGALFTLLSLVPAYALEQGEPQDTLSLKEIPFFEYDLKNKATPGKYELKLPVAIQTEGLRGPLPVDNPVAAYFWEKFKDSGIKRELEINPNSAKNYQTPYMRLIAVQSIGTPVKIKLLAPKIDEIIMPLAGEGGKSGNTRYKTIKRIFTVRLLDQKGEMSLAEDKEKIKLVENNDTLEISWIPSMVEERRGPKLTAPIVMEINLHYEIRLESILDGKYLGGWHQEGWVERRVAWIAMPVCGLEFGEDDEPITCSANMDPRPAWQEYSLGPVSIQVPSSWESDIRDGNGKFELGSDLAGLTVVRVDGAEEQAKYIKERTEKKIVISGLKAVEYTGLVNDGKLKARMIIFNEKLSDGKVLSIATVLKDDKYSQALDASLNSITIDNGKAKTPDIAAIPTPHIPDLPKVGNGDYSYANDNIPQKEYAQATQMNNKTDEEKTGTPQEQAAPEKPDAATIQNTGNSSVKLKKINGFSDFVGRNEALLGNGSPDSQLELTIEAPDQTIISLILRETDTQNAIWDTTNGNSTWLIAVTKKNKLVNRADGSLLYKLGTEKEKLDLWLQDNHLLASGKKELELVLSFDNNTSLIIPMKR